MAAKGSNIKRKEEQLCKEEQHEQRREEHELSTAAVKPAWPCTALLPVTSVKLSRVWAENMGHTQHMQSYDLAAFLASAVGRDSNTCRFLYWYVS